jgi:hypothetical protein
VLGRSGSPVDSELDRMRATSCLLVSRSAGVALIGEASPVLQFEVPAQAHGLPLFQGVARRQNPDGVFPLRLDKEPRTVAG